MAEAVNTYQEPEAEDPAHIEAMLKKAEGLSAKQEEELPTETDQESRPEWLPEKFKSAEEMAKAYSELETKLSEGDQKPPEDAEEAAREAVENVGLDFDSMTAEFSENDGLTDETYQKLEDAGIPSYLVDQFIDGQKAVANQMRTEVFAQVGGEQEYSNMIEWAATNLEESAINSFNDAIDSGDPNAAKLAISGLHAQYRMDNGSEPSLITGQAANTSSGAFSSVAELTAAMSDPRYGRDPSYRKAVADKLAKSSVI